MTKLSGDNELSKSSQNGWSLKRYSNPRRSLWVQTGSFL